MTSIASNTFITLGFPVEVRLGGDRIPSDPSGRVVAMNQPTDGKRDTPKPLNRRWVGDGTGAAKKCWSWLKPAGRQAEKEFLTLNLLFPFLYGGALAACLWWVWMALERPFHPAWIIAPLAIILTADWTENLIQLAQIHHYVSSNEGRIQDLWIQSSSCATIMKLWLTSGLSMSLIGLAVRMIVTLSDRRMATDAAE